MSVNLKLKPEARHPQTDLVPVPAPPDSVSFLYEEDHGGEGSVQDFHLVLSEDYTIVMWITDIETLAFIQLSCKLLRQNKHCSDLKHIYIFGQGCKIAQFARRSMLKVLSNDQ